MEVKVGSCPDNWGVWFAADPRQTPWWRFPGRGGNRRVRVIELGPSGYLPTDPGKLRDESTRGGLNVSGTFLMTHLEDASAWPQIERGDPGRGARS